MSRPQWRDLLPQSRDRLSRIIINWRFFCTSRLSKIWLTSSDPLLCLAEFDSANLSIFYKIFTNLCPFFCSFLEILWGMESEFGNKNLLIWSSSSRWCTCREVHRSWRAHSSQFFQRILTQNIRHFQQRHQQMKKNNFHGIESVHIERQTFSTFRWVESSFIISLNTRLIFSVNDQRRHLNKHNIFSMIKGQLTMRRHMKMSLARTTSLTFLTEMKKIFWKYLSLIIDTCSIVFLRKYSSSMKHFSLAFMSSINFKTLKCSNDWIKCHLCRS